jgi:glycosyltransferase involved in cell wall biosynthesis
VEVLFIHQAFPAQFGRIALELADRYGWVCRFLVEHLSNCPSPSPSMLERLSIEQFDPGEGDRDDSPTPWPQIFGKYLGLCRAVLDAVEARPEWHPDLVIAHGGRGAPTLFLRDAISCPIINYCEYFFAKEHADISYRVDLPQAADVAPFYPRCINAPVLTSLLEADGGYSPTRWQRDSFPARFHPKIEVHFDGIDTALYRPRPRETLAEVAGRAIPPKARVVTFAARGLESVRGFDLFAQVAARIAVVREDVVFLVAGGDSVYYGWDDLFTGGKSFREWALSRVSIDPGRLHILGQVAPETLAEVLARSDLHIYVTVPFVPSWSLASALASGAVVLASDVAPVREWVQPGVTGLVEPLFDLDRLTETALRVLDHPADYAPLGLAAREWTQEHLSIDSCLPPLRDYFERMANRSAP